MFDEVQALPCPMEAELESRFGFFLHSAVSEYINLIENSLARLSIILARRDPFLLELTMEFLTTGDVALFLHIDSDTEVVEAMSDDMLLNMEESGDNFLVTASSDENSDTEEYDIVLVFLSSVGVIMKTFPELEEMAL